MGEAEVSAQNTAKVIHIVSKHVFRTEIPLHDLPSDRSALRFADRGHVLAKYHLAQELGNNKWDLHGDGTTKDHTKYVGSQVTLGTGQMLSTGFTSVCTEDAGTVLDVSIGVLKELSYIHDQADERNEKFKEMLSNLVGVMSDRAAVMKAFDKQLNTKRKEILGTQENLEFLHCNAHFLLGMSSGADSVLKEVESAKKERLGRDKLPVFQRFRAATECATSHYVRTACDTIGPRGDEKSGCRDQWEAYLHMQDKVSFVSSYKSNRFNNYFESAAALHYHRTDIIRFFTKFKENKNLKQQSVLADAESDEIDDMIAALGIVFYKITGPYWNLVKSNTPYLAFYQFASQMAESFQRRSVDASDLLDRNMEPLFHAFDVKNNPVQDELFGYVEKATATTKAIIADILQKLCGKFLQVTERQLTDFLPGGRYHNVQDLSTKERMAHCQLTNLIGEACFGDLDFSIFKRRNASIHHHSTVNMLKRNKTMSDWFNKKSIGDQTKLLTLSTKLGPKLRVEHMESQQAVETKTQNILKETKQKQEEKLQKNIEYKQNIVKLVKEYGGPVTSPSDVDIIYEQQKLKSKKLDFLKTEMKYLKFVLGVKSPLIRITGSADQLKESLKQYLEGT